MLREPGSESEAALGRAVRDDSRSSPILGEAPDVPGLFLANGFSRHEVMHAPATGKILSDSDPDRENGPERCVLAESLALRTGEDHSRDSGTVRFWSEKKL